MEAEDRELARRADLLVSVPRAEGVRSVLDDREPVLFGEGAERVEIDGLPGEVDRYDGTRPLGDAASDVLGIQTERLRVHLREDGPGAAQLDHIRCRGPRERRHDHLVVRREVKRPHGEVEPSCRRVYGDRVLDTQALTERLLEVLHTRAGGDPARPHALENRLLLLLPEGGARERQELGARS